MKKLLLFLLFPLSAFSQKDTSFWFAAPDVNQFLTGNPHDRPILLRLTTFNNPSTITISIPANPTFTPLTNTIAANSSGVVDLSAWADQIENATANAVANKGILIKATADITAYYEIVSNCNCNPELFSLKGRNALGNEFIIPSQTEWAIDSVRFPQAKAAFDIIATEDNTVLNITPSKHLIGRLPGIPFSITLNKGQTFSNQGLYRSGISLLNGSIVTSSKPIAVTTFEDLLMADGPCADLAGDQLIPTSIWGNEFVVVKGDLTNKDKVVVTAMTNGTAIYLNGNNTPAATINRGSSFEINLSAQAVSYITSNNKISVYHYTGVNCEIGSAVIPKINCTGSNDVAITRSISEDAVVFITTRAGNQSGFTVNGNNAVITAADFSPVPGSAGNFVYCKKNLNAVMPTSSPTRFLNSIGKFQLGFLNGASPASYSGCRYGFFSDFKSSNVTRSQLEICRLDSTQLNAFGGITYQWSPSAGLNNSSIANPKASPNTTTDYKVIITTAEGCIDSAFVKVVVNTNCIPSILPCNTWLYTPTAPSYVEVGDLDISGNKVTVEATFNRTTPYTGGFLYAGNLVSKHDNPNSVNYLLRPNSAEITTSNGYFVTPGVCEIELNKTYHVAMVYDGSSLKFYRNGFLLSQVPATGDLFQSDLRTRIGWLDYTVLQENFIGYINEVRIWNIARTQSQIQAFINSTLPNPTTQVGLMGYYSFDNLLNKQGNPAFNGSIGGSASINNSNPSCNYTGDSCSLVVNPPRDIINEYTPALSLNICKNELTVLDASKYNVGDTVLLIQMKGAIIDSTNTASFGNLANYNSAGNYEFNYVKSKTGNVVELKNILTRQYDLPQGKVQLVRVPYFNSLLVTNTLTCLPWDGNKGGVLAFNVRDSLTLAADLDVTGNGFQGGNSPNTFSNTLYCARNNFNYPAGSVDAAAKGESITTIGNNISWGKGAPANAGGGGLGHNSGGGGGSNAGGGGFGGYQLLTCGNAPYDNRGIGGHSLNYSNALNKIFMGGGGGSGHVDNIGGSAMRGGNGGGIVIINSPKIDARNYKIIANGANAPQCTLTAFGDCHDASGGGGGGGAIVINSGNYATAVNIEAKAGKGADVIVYNPSIGADKIGPGGGGGGGVIWLNNASLPANVNANVSAGANGVIPLDNNNAWGATTGTAGSLLFNVALPISTVPFAANIDSVRIKDSATSCNSFAFKGLAFIRTVAITQWQWSFGDASTGNTQNTTHTYALPGTYTVKLVVTDLNGCIDSVSIPVTSSGASNDFGYKQDVCNPLSIEFTSSGTAPTSSYWSFGDGNTSTGNSNPTHMYVTTGNYTVKYVYEIGTCRDSISKNISINVIPENIILTPDTTICFSTTKQLFSVPSLKFCWSPTTYLNDPLLANPTTSTPVPITYYLTAEVAGTNVITNGNFSAGNTGFTSDYAFVANNTTEGEYFVGTSPQAWNAALSNCTDHTTGNGNMLLVNGSPAPNVKVWTQTVAVTPNTNYAFSSWIQALHPPNPAKLSFSINGLDIGTSITASLPTCTWSQFYTTWNSGSNTSALISIVNKNTIVQGNDFALDDISFAPVLIKRDSVRITIDTPLVRTIADTAACLNSGTTLTTTGAVAYSWTPATGLSANNIANPIATPASTTEYIVSGTNTFGCIAKDTVTVTVKPAPVIVKSANDTICNLQSAQLNVSGGVSYSWLPGGTLNNTSIPNPVATPTGTTTYTVTVTGANACTSTDSIKISIDTVVVNTIADASACLNTGTMLSTTGAAQYSWFPATGLSAANIANPIATPANNTQYVVTGTSAAGCTDTDTVNIIVKPLPVVTTSLSDAVCLNKSIQLNASGGVSYSWFPAQTLSNASVANPIATPLSNTMYYVTVTGANNCTNIDSVVISVKPLPFISKSADATICNTQSAQLTSAGGVSYSWTPSATLNNANIANPIASPTANTTYTVLVTGNNGCSAKDSLSITVNSFPVFSVSPGYSTCVNGTAPLSASGGTSYLWSPAQYLSNATIENPIATVASNTIFTVLINDSICKVSASLSTTVTTNVLPPVITATKSSDIDCVFSTVQLKATGADVFSWSPATNLSNSGIANPIAKPAATQQYTVVGKNSANGCQSKDTITVFVKAPADPKAYIPNTFTPNGDGTNDCFRVRDFGTIKILDVMVFNRFGNLVFQTKDINHCWDGRYKGQPAEVGNYVYYIKVLNNCGEEINKGNLLLIR